MSVRQFPFPRHPNFGKWMWCKWCGDPIPEVIDGKRSTQRYWHPECAHQFNLHTRQAVQYEHLVQRDGERCALCPPGTPKPMRWLAEPEGQILDWSRRAIDKDWLSELWCITDESRTWPREDQMLLGLMCRITRVCALEVDHRAPLWSVADLPPEERRWYFGPENLWLLCPMHHKLKTKREAAERAARRAFVKAQLGLPL